MDDSYLEGFVQYKTTQVDWRACVLVIEVLIQTDRALLRED